MATCSFSWTSITKFEPVSQFSETEAAAVTHFKCDSNGDRSYLFIFKKNIDSHWLLTDIKIGPGENLTNGEAEMIESFRSTLGNKIVQ